MHLKKIGKTLAAMAAAGFLFAAAAKTAKSEPNWQAEFTKDSKSDSEFMAADCGINENIHNIAFSFADNKSRHRHSTAVRGKYSAVIPIGKFFSESALAGGILDYTQKDFLDFPSIFLFGAGQHAGINLENSKARFSARAGGYVSGQTLSDNFGRLTQKNNDIIDISCSFDYLFPKKIFDENGIKILDNSKSNAAIHAEAFAERKRYNPGLYFFTEKNATDLGIKIEAIQKTNSNKMEFGPFFCYRRTNIERDGRTDRDSREFGIYAALNDIGLGFNPFARGSVYMFRPTGSNEIRFSIGADCNIKGRNYSFEAVGKNLEEVVSGHKEFAGGIKMTATFGKHQRKSELNEFYTDSGKKDDDKLTLNEQAMRLGSIRKRNEWTGNNLAYASADSSNPFHEEQEVYSHRKGDCDEQANLNRVIDNFNNNKAEVLLWFDGFDGFNGHGAELVQDKTNGQWFLSEYGNIFKVNAGKNADIYEAGEQALKQNHAYTSLEIKNPEGTVFLFQDSSGYFSSGRGTGPLPKMQRPQIEYGHETLIGIRDFLFR